MTTLRDITSALECTVHHYTDDFDTAPLTTVCASDLMSDVLALVDEGILLITSLASDQALRTADIVGARAVLLVNGKRVHQSMVELAEEFGIALMATKHDTYRVCAQLGSFPELCPQSSKTSIADDNHRK
ncbi:MAG: hypothetical protein GF344_06445 [Chitinivibrionales bacterium]|nr:hypothetical protein [Chitinivibrionales bacterium]MBD3356565.1 hypothetical protein [Chitinivibrionales bacterium]